MSKTSKSRSYFNGKLPRFTKKELARLNKSKPSNMLLRAAQYLKESEKESKVA